MTHLEAAMGHVNSLLDAALTVKVHEGYVPLKESLPATVFAFMNAGQVATQSDINMSRYEVLVKAVGEGKSKAGLLDIAEDIQTALHQKTSTSSGLVCNSFQIGPATPENIVEDGEPYSQVVIPFEIIIRKSA